MNESLLDQNNNSTLGIDPTDLLPWQLRFFLSVYLVGAMIFCFFSNVMITGNSAD